MTEDVLSGMNSWYQAPSAAPSANPSAWALPTTGNLANDDYARSREAWGKAHPFTGEALSNPTGSYDAEGSYVGPSSKDWLAAGWTQGMSGSGDETWVDSRNDAWGREQDKAWSAQLTPEQRAERARLYAERDAKVKRNGMLAALAGFGGIAGAGMLGAGMLGSGFSGAAAGGLDALAGADIAGGLIPEFGSSAAYTAGLGGTGAAAGVAGGAAPWDSFYRTLTSPIGRTGGSLLSQLIAGGGNAYMGNKQAGQYGDVINQINQLYAPDSPYAKQMEQALARKDSAAGRNSQYGDRAVQLAAALTQAKSNALTSPGYGNLLAQRGTNQNIPINGLLAILGGGAGQDLITQAGGGIGNYFKSFFGNEGEKYSPSTPNTEFDNSWMNAYAPG